MKVICVSHWQSWDQQQEFLSFCLMIFVVLSTENADGNTRGNNERELFVIYHGFMFSHPSSHLAIPPPPKPVKPTLLFFIYK